MRVLFASLRTPSHFFPLVPFLDACRRAGHEVAVAAPADLTAHVAKTGAKLLPVEHPGEAVLRPLWDRAMKGEGDRIVIGEVFAGECARFALPGLLGIVDAFRPDVIVRESQEYAAMVVAEKTGVPCARVGITSSHKEHEVFAIAAPAVDRHRAGLRLAPEPAAAERLAGEASLTLFPASLGGSTRGDGPLYRFRTTRKTPPPLPSWWEGRTGPFVYVTFGTVIGNLVKFKGVYRAAMDAVKDLPVRALLTVGAEQPLEDLGGVPGNVHVERFVPQDDVLPHAAAVVCHGGSGTVLGSLGAGVPLVVAPMFADQPINAEGVASLGAGIGLPVQAPTADALRDALVRVLEQEPYRAAARKVAAEMAALPLVDEAPSALERLATGPGP
jgi:UDP:flavonoid glycosyltransferase YjiC (YdhE family)